MVVNRKPIAVRHADINKDFFLSVLLGPLRLVIPTLTYVLIYPIVIQNQGIEVVGLWSLAAVLVTFISAGDVGFSQILTRNQSEVGSRHDSRINLDLRSAVRGYSLSLLVALSVFVTFGIELIKISPTLYSSEGLEFSIALLLSGGVLQLVGKLYAAILSARQDNYTVQIVNAATPIITLTFALFGALNMLPIEGLAIGTLLSSIVAVVYFRYRLRKIENILEHSNECESYDKSLIRFKEMARSGWYLYSCSIGMLLRGPVCRFVVAIVLGLPAAAAFDIAIRVSQTIREAVAGGFSVLFPIFSRLYSSSEEEKIVQLTKLSLKVLMAGGMFCLSLLYLFAPELLALWLGEIPEGLIFGVKVMAIWQIITIFNVPYWYLLLSSHNEKVAAFSIWLHTLLIIMLLPFSSLIDISLEWFFVYWVITSLLTQCAIYYCIHTRLLLLLPTIMDVKVVLVLAIGFAFLVFSIFIGAREASGVGNLASILAAIVFYIPCVSAILWPEIKKSALKNFIFS